MKYMIYILLSSVLIWPFALIIVMLIEIVYAFIYLGEEIKEIIKEFFNL